jgi:hypothetical protein
MVVASQPVERAGIGGEDDERAAAERKKDDIGHVRSPVLQGETRPGRGQVSIGKASGRRKEKIKAGVYPARFGFCPRAVSQMAR